MLSLIFGDGLRIFITNVAVGVTAISAVTLAATLCMLRLPAQLRQAVLYIGLASVLLGSVMSIAWSFNGIGLISYDSAESTHTNWRSQVQNYSSIGYLELLVLAWLFGTGFASYRLHVGYVLLHRLRKDMQPLATGDLFAAVQRVSHRLGVRVTPPAYESSMIDVPMSFGVLDTAIVFPANFSNAIDRCDLEAIVIHEIEHIRQRHRVVRVAQCIARVIFWWHPLVHLLDRCLRAVQEEVCDNAVVRERQNATRFAHCLVSLAEQAHQRALSQASCGVISCRSELSRRVQNLLNGHVHRGRGIGKAAVLGLIMFALSLVGIHAGLNILEANHTSPQMWGQDSNMPLRWWGGSMPGRTQ